MKGYLAVVFVSLASLFVFWMPLLLKSSSFWGIEFGKRGMETIVQNFDGLNYLAIAKTLYDPALLSADFAGLSNPPIYYSAHFPVYPLLIRLFDTALTGPQALLAATVVSNALLALGMYLFFTTFVKDKKLATVLSIASLFFPARMLSVRAVGASEPIFIFFVLSSIAMFSRGKSWWSAILGSLAVLTRSPGIFLFGGYALYGIVSILQGKREESKKLLPFILMPLTLVALFGFYAYRFGDFWAYFSSGSELHPVFFPPFMIFSNMQKWITEMWREEIVYLYLFYALGIGASIKKLVPFSYALVYGLVLLAISHRDLGRYALPLAPIALLGYANIIPFKKYTWLWILIVPIYLLGWQFVVGNTQAVSDWSNLI